MAINTIHLLHPTEKTDAQRCITITSAITHFITWVTVWRSLVIKARERTSREGGEDAREYRGEEKKIENRGLDPASKNKIKI